MRIDSTSLPQAALTHSKVHGSGKTFPGKGAENSAAAGATTTDQTAKTAPQGLSNAISKLESKENSNKGIENALAMLTRNLSRYQVTTPPADTGTTTPTTPEASTPATDTTTSTGTETTPTTDTAATSDNTGAQTGTTA